MIKLLDDIRKIEKFSKSLKGIFTLPDLKSIFPLHDSVTFYRKLKALEKAEVLKRAVKKIYVTDGYDLKTLCWKINPETYISFETVLADELLIGTVPAHTVKAVKLGKRREYSIGENSVIHAGISPDLFFGFEKKEGINVADKEKAFLDTLYFYLKGYKYYFDIYSDIDTLKLDMKVINTYLSKYKNPKFVSFVRRYLDENISR